MSDEPNEAFATRLPPELASRLRAALDETGMTRADILRSAVAYYLRRNPDGVEALAREGTVDHMIAQMEGDND